MGEKIDKIVDWLKNDPDIKDFCIFFKNLLISTLYMLVTIFFIEVAIYMLKYVSDDPVIDSIKIVSLGLTFVVYVIFLARGVLRAIRSNIYQIIGGGSK